MAKAGTPKQVEQAVRGALERALTEEELRSELEALAREPAFSGLTWLWGPKLYAKNRVLFRPFILSNFGTWMAASPRRWKEVGWSGQTGKVLSTWLEAVDRADDIELFRRLYQWSLTRHRGWHRQRDAYREELRRRVEAAATAASRRVALAKMDLGFDLDEETATAIYASDPRAASPFILRHLPFYGGWGGQKRRLWTGLLERARAAGDSELAGRLYRRQVPVKVWSDEVLALAGRIEDPSALVAELEQRHPEGWSLDLGATFHELIRARGRDVLPYLERHLTNVWPRFGRRSGYDKVLALARERQWWDLWAALLRTSGTPDGFNKAVKELLTDRSAGEDEVVRRLLMLAGVSRELNLPGLGLAAVHNLKDDIAVRFHERFPALLSGPFKLHVSVTYGHTYPKLIDRLIEADDQQLLDFMASRLINRGGPWSPKDQIEAAERVAGYFEKLREHDPAFCRRAAAVLGQVPAFSIWSYNQLIRANRLARLLLERSSSSLLEDAEAMQDLIEAPEIHVQALAYRALGLDDPRARAIAAANVEILLGTLLRPLHRATRLLAFSALLNAAHDLECARRIHRRAREALALPDIRYPKEQLVGLIGKLLHRWPELRTAAEQPTVYRVSA